MKLAVSILSLLFLQSAFCQRTVDVTNGDHSISNTSFFTVSGTPFVNEKYVKLVSGTPYFSENWLKGVLVSERGQEYKGYAIKLNLHDNQVLYRDETGAELIATTSIKEVVLTDELSNNFRFIFSSFLPQNPSSLGRGWYQWLCSGKAGLYKQYSKQLSESTPYGASTTEQRIATKEKFFVLYNNVYTEVKKLKDAPAVLSGKQAELEEFLKTKDDKNASTEDRFLALIEYYNSLFREQK